MMSLGAEVGEERQRGLSRRRSLRVVEEAREGAGAEATVGSSSVWRSEEELMDSNIFLFGRCYSRSGWMCCKRYTKKA
jgi:hypothetical protein